MRFSRRRDQHQPGSPSITAGGPIPTSPGPPPQYHPTGAVRPPTEPIRHKLAEAARLATIPMPFDVAADHEPLIVYAGGFQPVAELNGDPGQLLTVVLEELGRGASQAGCDAVYSVHHTLAVDNGVMYITAMGTGSRPITNLDSPPVGG